MKDYKICPTCGKKFYKNYYYSRNYWNKQKYCSIKCSGTLFQEGICPKNAFKKGHKTWNKGRHIQSNTGRTHFKKGHKINSGRHHTEKTKVKLRKARMKQRLPRKDTNIERLLQKEFAKKGIEFETHKNILGITQPDIFLKPNICIYADGDYWHSLPEVKNRDIKIDKGLSENGFEVYRFLGSEIKNDIKSCVNQVL